MVKQQNPIAGAGMANGVKTPVQPTMLARAVAGVRYVISGTDVNGWFGPGQPVQPLVQTDPTVVGRQFDYNIGHNIRREPRDSEGISFQQMRNLADGYDLLRLVIETRKDQMAKLTWSFGLKPEIAKKQKLEKQIADAKARAAAPPPEPPEPPKEGEVPVPPKPEVTIPEMPVEDPRIQQLQDFFAYPDGEHDWDTWLRAVLEDMFVLDAATVYPRPTLGGGLHSLELLDGATVKRLLDATGRTPQPPDPAYQQILKGIPAVDYSRDELVYRPRNVRTNKVYGYSPVEQIIMTVNIAMRRQVYSLQYYTEGNIPEALIGVPPEWNPDQIAQFQKMWDSINEGNTAERRHAKFVPGGMNVTMLKGDAMKDEYDDWLARIICFAFSISPQALIKMMNRATAGTAQDQALQEGLLPVMKWVKSLLDYIIVKYFGFTDLEFKWDEEDETGPLEQMQVLTGYVAAAIMDEDEARDKLGMDPRTPEQVEAMKPPAPPAFQGNGPPGAGGDPEEDSGDGNPKKMGGTGRPVGKSVSSVLRKVKSISRNRASAKVCISDISALVTPALAALGKRLSRELADGAVGKAIQVDYTAQRLIDQLTVEELIDLAPDLAEILQRMAEEGGKDALIQVLGEVTQDQLDQVNARAVAYASSRSAELVTDVSASTRDMLRATVTEGMEEGWSNDKLASALEDSYAFDPERAEVIARTETAYADVQGNLDAYKASGVVQGKQWIIAQDEICDDCVELDGVVVGLEEQFPDGGDGPPLHPNCRCDVVPVLTEEDSE